MQRVSRIFAMLFAVVLAGGISLAVAVPGSNDSTAKTSTKTSMKTKTTTTNSAAKSPANHALAAPENLSGSISVVDPTDKEVTLVGSNGVPYDFKLTKKTQVELSDKKIETNELATESHKQATVRFVPTSEGNLAESIQISAS